MPADPAGQTRGLCINCVFFPRHFLSNWHTHTPVAPVAQLSRCLFTVRTKKNGHECVIKIMMRSSVLAGGGEWVGPPTPDSYLCQFVLPIRLVTRLFMRAGLFFVLLTPLFNRVILTVIVTSMHIPHPSVRSQCRPPEAVINQPAARHWNYFPYRLIICYVIWVIRWMFQAYCKVQFKSVLHKKHTILGQVRKA